MVSLIQTTIGTVLGPLVGELAASRQTIERQADELRELERELGKFAAERAAAEARYATLEARMGVQAVELTSDPSPAHWRALVLWSAVVVLLAALATLVVLQAWPR
jgi:hypothetical protein